jgi:hypothetical protein
MYDLVAEDFAIEDTLYYLSEAISKDALDFETYLKVLIL